MATEGGTLTINERAAASIPLTNPNAIAIGTYYIKVLLVQVQYADIKPVNVTINTQPIWLINQMLLLFCDDNFFLNI